MEPDNEKQDKDEKKIEGCKVCVVEDDKFFRQLLEKKLTSAGATVDFAENGEIALKTVRDGNFDIIILDLMLPGMDGFDFLRERGKDKKSAHIPVIILSNFGDTTQIDTAKKLGVRSYLIKAAVSMQTVVDEIKKVLDTAHKES